MMKSDANEVSGETTMSVDGNEGRLAWAPKDTKWTFCSWFSRSAMAALTLLLLAAQAQAGTTVEANLKSTDYIASISYTGGS